MHISKYESLFVASVVFLSTNCGGYIFGISSSKCGLFSVGKSSIIISQCVLKSYCYFLAEFKMTLNVCSHRKIEKG